MVSIADIFWGKDNSSGGIQLPEFVHAKRLDEVQMQLVQGILLPIYYENPEEIFTPKKYQVTPNCYDLGAKILEHCNRRIDHDELAQIGLQVQVFGHSWVMFFNPFIDDVETMRRNPKEIVYRDTALVVDFVGATKPGKLGIEAYNPYIGRLDLSPKFAHMYYKNLNPGISLVE